MVHPIPPRRFYQKTLFWLLLLFLAPFLILALLWMLSANKLGARLDKLRSQGMPTSAAELNDFYRVPADATDTTDLWVRAIEGLAVIESAEAVQTLPIVGPGPVPIPLPPDEWKQLEAARRFLDEVRPQMQMIREAAAAGGVARLPTDLSMGLAADLTYTQDVRQIARLLQLDAFVCVHDGRKSQALENILHIFAASDMLQAEPTIISQLVRIALHAVASELTDSLSAHVEWNDQQLAAVQSAAARADFVQGMTTAIQGERAITLTALQSMPLGPLQQTNAARALDLFQQTISGLNAGWPQAIETTQQISADLKRLAGNMISKMTNMGVLLIVPATEQAILSGADAVARQRCLIVSLAARRFRLQHGQFPDSLTELIPLLPGEDTGLLADPFNGQPLLFREADGYLLIYSVGRNLLDDGGEVVPLEERRRARDTGMMLKLLGAL